MQFGCWYVADCIYSCDTGGCLGRCSALADWGEGILPTVPLTGLALAALLACWPVFRFVRSGLGPVDALPCLLAAWAWVLRTWNLVVLKSCSLEIL